MRLFGGRLWRDPRFLTLWAGESVSLFGSQITTLALPLAAVLTLHATAAQLGLLSALQYAPFLFIGLFAGVWVDRIRRRPLMLSADLGRALILGTIPLAAWLGRLSLGWVYLVALVAGLLLVFFDVSYQAFLPALVSPEDLLEGNSKLGVSSSLAQVAGPTTAGLLVQLVSATTAILGDAVSFLVSALCLLSLRVPEDVPHAAQRRSLWAELREGLTAVLGNPLLRGIAGCTSTTNLFGSLLSPLFLLYAVRNLHLTPGELGIVFGAGGVGALIGALVSSPLARRLGLGRSIIGGILLGSALWLVAPFIHGPSGTVAAALAAAWCLKGLGNTVYNINQLSLRQVLTPDRLQGRVTAAMRMLAWGTIPLGALLGGAVASALGVQRTLLLGAAGTLLGVPWLLVPPLRRQRSLPTPVAAM